MKRLKIILGRSGTTLVAISLALLLVSVIPQPQYYRSEGSGNRLPERFSIISSQQDLTPQQELDITVTVEGTVKIYLLEMHSQLQFSVDNGTEEGLEELNKSLNQVEQLVKETIETQPDKIIWEREIQNGSHHRIYIPTRIINATLVIYNPTSEMVHTEHTVLLKSSLAPTEKVQTIAYGAAQIGILLALPWLMDSWKQRKHK